MAHALIICMRKNDAWCITVGVLLDMISPQHDHARDPYIDVLFVEAGIAEITREGLRKLVGCLPLRVQSIEDDNAT
eukprot:gene35655-31713_t